MKDKFRGKRIFSLSFSEHARLNAAIRKGITMNIDLLNLTYIEVKNVDADYS